MPLLKPITGRSKSVVLAIEYLSRKGQAPADYINCYELDPLTKENVAQQMDNLRKYHDNNGSYGSKKIMTYKHYVLSPDPNDNVNLEELRDYAKEWANKFFSEYQVAIYYHNDNVNDIPHAHIVINNTNIETGKRLGSLLNNSFVKKINREAQNMAASRGWNAFDNKYQKYDLKTKASSSTEDDREQLQTLQRKKYHQQAQELQKRSEASWVEDIRTRIWCAMQLATNEKTFVEECKRFGLTVTESSQKRRGKDFVYTHPSKDTWKITGGKLGSDWTRFMIGSQIARNKVLERPKITGEELQWLHRAIDYLEKYQGAKIGLLGISHNKAVAVEDFASLIEVCQIEDVKSLEDLESLIRSAPDSSTQYLSHLFEVALETNALPQKRAERHGPRKPWAEKQKELSEFVNTHQQNKDETRHYLPQPSESSWVVSRSENLTR